MGGYRRDSLAVSRNTGPLSSRVDPTPLSVVLVLRNTRPATGIQNPEPRNSLKKKNRQIPLQNPSFEKLILKYRQKAQKYIFSSGIFRRFSVFFQFFETSLGSAARDEFSVFSRNFGARGPVAGRAFLNTCNLSYPPEPTSGSVEFGKARGRHYKQLVVTRNLLESFNVPPKGVSKGEYRCNRNYYAINSETVF